MFSSQKEFLDLFGWDDFFESQCSDLVSRSMFPARVICEERNLYRVQTGIHNVLWAAISGKMQFLASTRLDYPLVSEKRKIWKKIRNSAKNKNHSSKGDILKEGISC